MDSFYVLGDRFRGNDSLGLVRQERGELLHSAKVVLPGFGRPAKAQPPGCWPMLCYQNVWFISG